MTTTAPEHSDPRAFVDPYAVDAAEVRWPSPAGWDQDQDIDRPMAMDRHGGTGWGTDQHQHQHQGVDHLPPPNPAERLSLSVAPRDRRRIDLHAALTAAGIPPYPEDRDAIDQLSALSGSVNAALQRWLHHLR
ncbi:hypothetical protein J2X68_007147 [Streptomyces sp. 3330]|uniref:hypothetical protein n=1 Tax=Streptomyces sp. 3330 TaxID=2817755 RepID=UPI002861FF5F|nr:hypothetical protein [Streptomyces sp. 3330]MDR6980407.1 hypothetical protein [Streptomyces sp. 3330]